LIVAFQWAGMVESPRITASWKQPDGQILSRAPAGSLVYPDVAITTPTGGLICYWSLKLDSTIVPGIWAIETQIDGQPAGAYWFEILAAARAVDDAGIKHDVQSPTLEEIFAGISPSLVWMQKFDGDHRRLDDVTSGFILGKDRVLSTTRSVDAASELQIEFSDGRKIKTDKIVALSRGANWAIIGVDTGNLPALRPINSSEIVVGEKLLAFRVMGGTRAIENVAISGRSGPAGSVDRILLSSPMELEAEGSPLLDLKGSVIGLLVANETLRPVQGPFLNGFDLSRPEVTTAIPMNVVSRQLPEKEETIRSFIDHGQLIEPLSYTGDLLYVETSQEPTGSSYLDRLPPFASYFSHKNIKIWVISEWRKRGTLSKGTLSAKLYDQRNALRDTASAKRLSFSSTPVRSSLALDSSTLEPGMYRVDLTLDERPVWRTFIRFRD
jgi:S1-C subfamily serine protease